MIRRTAFITLLLLSLTLQPAYCRILSEYNSEFTSDLLPIGPLLPPRSKDPPSEPLSKDGDAPPAQDGEDKTFIIDKGVCLTSSNMFNETLCRQLDRRVRTFTCTDIGPIEGVDCSIPYIVDRCDSIWMWKEAFCLKSCGRCGKEGCTDIPPPGTLYFLTRAVLDQHGTNNGITITSPKDIIQYGVGTGVQGLISRVGNLANLREINVSGNVIERIPEEIGRLRRLETLDIHNNCIRELPESLGGLASLQELNAMGNRIERVPESLGRLRSLQVLGLKDNCLTELPDVFTGLQDLREVYLTGNTLESLPDSMCECQSLVKFNCLIMGR
eukprot:jgi/Picre1/27303/NNA_000272.t1